MYYMYVPPISKTGCRGYLHQSIRPLNLGRYLYIIPIISYPDSPIAR